MSKRLSRINSSFLLKLNLLAWISYKLLTFNLWFSFNREFPLVPPLDVMSVNVVLQDVLSVVSLALLLLSLIKFNKWVVVPILFFELLLASFDMMRWQPPVFQFYLTLLIFVFKPKEFKSYLILLLSATYLFSGLNKLNLRFINAIWSYSILIDFLGIAKEVAYLKIIKGVGFIIPMTEIISGILVLTKWRKIGFQVLVITHLFILLYVGPFGINFNEAIWPWNILMLMYCLILSYQEFALTIKRNYFVLAFTVIIFILPLLNFSRHYYSFFSFTLYSGARSFLYINIKDDHNHYRAYATREKDGFKEINVNEWSYENLNVPTTDDEILHKKIIEAFKTKNPTLLIHPKISHYPYKERKTFRLSP